MSDSNRQEDAHMSKEFVTFYNIAAYALLSEMEYPKYEIEFCGDDEFMTVSTFTDGED